jgi:iron complex outermembrane receptor protein
VRRKESLGGGRHHYGAEAFGESIVSNNLGPHCATARRYAALDFRALRRFSFSLGAREEVWRKWSGQFSPTAAGGVWLSRRVKLRAASSRAFRVPTYTDLYYHDPANLGSPGLRPERAWSYEGGLDLHAGAGVTGGATVFHRRERDGIDYVRRGPADIWRAANIQDLRFTGVEAWLGLAAWRGQRIDFRYTGLRGAQDACRGCSPSTCSTIRTTPARLRTGSFDRCSSAPASARSTAAPAAPMRTVGPGGSLTRGRVRLFLQFANLTSTRYQEIAGVDMPGRSVIGGWSWCCSAGADAVDLQGTASGVAIQPRQETTEEPPRLDVALVHHVESAQAMPLTRIGEHCSWER